MHHDIIYALHLNFSSLIYKSMHLCKYGYNYHLEFTIFGNLMQNVGSKFSKKFMLWFVAELVGVGNSNGKIKHLSSSGMLQQARVGRKYNPAAMFRPWAGWGTGGHC